MRQGSRLGRVIRGALATRASSHGANGTGAPARLLLAALALCALAGPLASSASAASGDAPAVGANPSAASGTKATIAAWVNPNGLETAYHFEFGPTTAYGRSIPSIPASAGSGEEAVFISQKLKGLSEGTVYHYRLVASNATGTTTGPDRALDTSPGLPDERAYEMVSPPDKNGGDISADTARTRAAADGNAVQFSSLAAFGDALGTAIATEYIAQRSSGGWSTHAITPRLNSQSAFSVLVSGLDPLYAGELSPDLSTGVFLSNTPLTADPNVEAVPNLYLRRDLLTPGPGSYSLLTEALGATEPLTAELTYKPRVAGASADFTHVIFESRLNLTPEASGEEVKLYEWVQGLGVRLAGILPASEGGGPAPTSQAGRGAWMPNYTPNTISRDGSRVIFTVAPGGEIGGDLYLREDGATTIRLNTSEPGTPLSGPAEFWNASTDGSKIVFSSNYQLYQYDVDAPPDHHLTLLSVDNELADGESLIDGVLDISDDGAYVYFAATSQLVPGGPPTPPGDDLLFEWHDGALVYIGALTGDDVLDGVVKPSWGLVLRTARATPDGKHLVFTSRSRHLLTGYDPGVCAQAVNQLCREVYVFSAEANQGAGALACASCRSDGATSVLADASTQFQGATGGAATNSHLNAPISSDGRYVFFTSGDSLLPEDTNGRNDAYSYDIESGQLHLLSSGTCSCDSSFMDAGADGADALFLTREPLVGIDTDRGIDLYDARSGGGIAAQNPPPVPASCAGADCRVPAPAAPPVPSVASAAFQGSPNPKPRRPKKHRRNRKAKQHHRSRAANHDRGTAR